MDEKQEFESVVVWLINKFDVDVYDTTHDLHRSLNFYQNPGGVLKTILHSIFSAGGPSILNAMR